MKLSKLFRGFGKKRKDTIEIEQEINYLIEKVEGIEKFLDSRHLLEDMWWDCQNSKNKLETKVKKLEKELNDKEA